MTKKTRRKIDAAMAAKIARVGGSCEIGLDLPPERSVMAGHARQAGLASVTGHGASSQPTEADHGEIFFIQCPQAPRSQGIREQAPPTPGDGSGTGQRSPGGRAEGAGGDAVWITKIADQTGHPA